jgi:hypothetical protein
MAQKRQELIQLQENFLFILHISNYLLTYVAAMSNSYNNLLFTTILSCGFYNCHRLGELVQNKDATLFDPRKIIKHSRVFVSNQQVSYYLLYHKTDPFYEGTEIIAISQKVADPVSLLCQYIACHNTTHQMCLLFFLWQNGTHPTCS